MNSYGECHATTTRHGIAQPCDKPAAGMVATDSEPQWPACPWHLNRAGAGNYTPLADILTEAMIEGAQTGVRDVLRQMADQLQVAAGQRRVDQLITHSEVVRWLRKCADTELISGVN